MFKLRRGSLRWTAGCCGFGDRAVHHGAAGSDSVARGTDARGVIVCLLPARGETFRVTYRAQVHPCFPAGTTEPQVADAGIRRRERRRQREMRVQAFACGCRCCHSVSPRDEYVEVNARENQSSGG